MKLKRNRDKKIDAALPVPKKELCTFKEGGQILGGLPEDTLRKNAKKMGLTIVDLNDVLPVAIKNHFRLIKGEVEAIRDQAIEKAYEYKAHQQDVHRNALIN